MVALKALMRNVSIMHWITFRSVSWNLLEGRALRPLLRHVQRYRVAVQNDATPPVLPSALNASPRAVLTWSLWKASIDSPVTFIFGLLFFLPSVPYLCWGLYRVVRRLLGVLF
jgi:hypothetical protein